VNRYTTPATSAPAEPWMHESRVPAMPSRFETHVLVPVVLAGVVALAVTLGLVIGAWRFGWPWDVTWIGCFVAFIAMLAWRLLWVDHLSWRLETITGRELDGVPGIGKPGPVGLLNPEQARRDAGKPETAPASDVPRMTRFVTRSFLEGTSEGAQAIRPNTQDRDNYVECRDALLRLGHSVGWDMTRDLDTTIAMIEKHVR
jgi:hypothetical protein